MVIDTPVLINDKVESIPVLLDSGADQSFILEGYAKEKELKIIEENVNLDLTIFGQTPKTLKSKKVEFELLTNDGTILTTAITVPSITGSFDPIEITPEENDLLSSENIELINIRKPKTPVALLGCDVFWHLMSNEQKMRLPSGRYVIPTTIGHLVCGSYESQYPTKTHALMATISNYSDESFTEKNFENYFEISNIGITGDEIDPTDKQLIDDFYKKVSINELTKRVSTKLPWKKDHKSKLANNKGVAICRLSQQYNYLSGKPEWKKLVENFETMEKTGKIEEVHNDPEAGYFIPYGLVFNEGSNTTKVRTVFDASSHKKGEISLNNSLHQGPSLVPDILAVLLRIRKGKYLLSGDIEKAFHAVEVDEEDRDALRFLWLKDVSKPPTKDNLRLMRFTCLPFGVNCSPFLLAMAIKYGIENSEASEKLKEAVKSTCYVDNIFFTSDSKDELQKLYQEAKHYFGEIGMNIREFSTNFPETFIKDEDRATNTDNVKILGYHYDIETDQLSVKSPPAPDPIGMNIREFSTNFPTNFGFANQFWIRTMSSNKRAIRQ
uniref:Reverse transcriptase domain-containing protein n=1 Tax=Caenorhabditis tropicalis TaxID=1561998 RepID=A0A1I7UJG8_9PELO